MKTRKRGVSTASPNQSGLSLEQIAEQTKISIRFLQAIESGDFDILPGGIFALSYIRQYAELTGADPERLLRLYDEHVNPRTDTPHKPAQGASESRSLLGRLFRGVPA